MAGDSEGTLWVGDNFTVGWQGQDDFSTRCGGQGVTIFCSMATPVRAPQIGPAGQP